jgi:hypothetical protein
VDCWRNVRLTGDEDGLFLPYKLDVDLDLIKSLDCKPVAEAAEDKPSPAPPADGLDSNIFRVESTTPVLGSSFSSTPKRRPAERRRP